MSLAQVPSRPVIVGHRGSPAESPENTMVSFRQSIEQGAEMLELDVRLSSDGVPVVIHDEKLVRVTGRPGTVGQRTLQHLRSLDAGGWFDSAFRGERLPTLEEALEELVPRVPINVEMKFRRGDPAPLTRAVAQVIRRLGIERRILVSSFRHDALPLMVDEIPGILTAPLYDAGMGIPGAEALDRLERQPLREEHRPGDLPWRGRIMNLHYSLATEDSVRAVRERGGGIVVWTVDHPGDMVRLAGYGVAGIITNRPALLTRILDALAPNPEAGLSPWGG